MAPSGKIVDACRVMEGRGFSKAKTKAALKDLLKVYDNCWEFISEDGYKVLFEAMLDREQEEKVLSYFIYVALFILYNFAVFGLLTGL